MRHGALRAGVGPRAWLGPGSTVGGAPQTTYYLLICPRRTYESFITDLLPCSVLMSVCSLVSGIFTGTGHDYPTIR